MKLQRSKKEEATLLYPMEEVLLSSGFVRRRSCWRGCGSTWTAEKPVGPEPEPTLQTPALASVAAKGGRFENPRSV
jgi:hypothetical protein